MTSSKSNEIEFHTELLPHQQNAVDKMLRSRVGALFMEMGTGKTRCALELVARRANKISNVVYFCPVNLKQTVLNEIHKHIRGDMPIQFDIIGIESMSSSVRVVQQANTLITSSTFVIVDESSFCKNHRAKRTDRITNAIKNSRYRLIMTGTPITKHYPDLYSQLYMLSPKILGYTSFYSFAANHLEYSDRFKGMIVRAHNTGYLAAKMEPYVYQVRKQDCLQLPDKIYTSRSFSMTPKQNRLYQDTKERIFEEIMDNPENSTLIYKLFTLLQEITSGFLNINDTHTECDNPRADILATVAEEIADEQAVIWCKYQHDVNAVYTTLGRDKCSIFTGNIKQPDRQAQLQMFKDGKTQYFVSTQATGGFGLTLIEAAYVVYYNNSFNYADRMQSEDRTHRIGQERNVQYIDLVCQNSIDDRIMDCNNRKCSLIRDFKDAIEKTKTKAGLKELKKYI